jgi:hypothetical protein
MKALKKMIEQFITGIKNKIGLEGSFAGKRLKPVFIHNKS